MALFGTPTGGEAVNLQSQSPEYQSAILEQTQRQLAPAYQRALGQTRQNMSSRGLLDSGVAAQSELGLQQDYMGQMADAATRAATGGADLAEDNRRRVENRGWAVQDRDTQLNWLREDARRREEAAGADRWANLIGGAASAGGMALGGPLGGWLAGSATSSLMPRQQPQSAGPYGTGLGGVPRMQMDPTLEQYLY